MGVEGEVDACSQLSMSGSTIGSNTVDNYEDNDHEYDDDGDDNDEILAPRPSHYLTSGSRGQRARAQQRVVQTDGLPRGTWAHHAHV